MTWRRTFKFKLYRSKKNRHLSAQLRIACEIWNHCIALQRRYYRLTGQYLHPNRLKVHLTRLKQRPQASGSRWSAMATCDRAHRSG